MIETADLDSSKARDDGDGFEFDDRAVDSESSSDSDIDQAMRPANRLLQQRAAMMNNDDDDFNIDDI
jgi:hypothetical protein